MFANDFGTVTYCRKLLKSNLWNFKGFDFSISENSSASNVSSYKISSNWISIKKPHHRNKDLRKEWNLPWFGLWLVTTIVPWYFPFGAKLRISSGVLIVTGMNLPLSPILNNWKGCLKFGKFLRKKLMKSSSDFDIFIEAAFIFVPFSLRQIFG